MIDSSLNWKKHINIVSVEVSRAISFLRHSNTFLPQLTLKTQYTGIVKPHFRYCCSVLGCDNSTELNQLQKLQTEPRGFYQTAALAPLADFLLTGSAGRILTSS